jgi:aspartate--ammonia ligase
MKIGHKLSDGTEYGLSSPNYDNWNLNGDLIVWDEVDKDKLELSSMGIRVDSY